MSLTRLTSLAAVLALPTVAACGGGPANARSAPPAVAAPPPPAAAAAQAPLSTGTVTGTVAEAINSGGYTYVRLQTGKDDVWIAASEFSVKTGERLTAPLEMAMRDFHSKTLNRDFPVVYFVSQVGREGQPLAMPAAPAMPSHQSAAAAAAVEPIPPAPGGLSIAAVWAAREKLAGQHVVVRGKVVKVNNGIMDRNWIHLQDGSGSAADRTNDLTVTTDADVRLGDIVTAAGSLSIKKDFGSGYLYEAILEKAALTAR